MTNFFTSNVGAKIFALILAIGIWVYVANGQSKMQQLPSKIPVEPRSVTNGLVAKLDTNEVTIKIYAENTDWSKLSAESFEAYIDLSGYQKGTYTNIPVRVISKIANVTIREISPSTVTVTLDPSIHKTVPVVANITGKPANGLVADQPVITPETVEVSGAKSDVDKVVEATAVIKLNGELTSLEDRAIKLQGFNTKGEEITGLVFNPVDVKVNIPIVKAGKNKTVGIKASLTGQPDDKYWISEVTLVPPIANITGNADILAKTIFISTESIDIEGINEDKTYTSSISLPDGIQLSENITEVTVDIKVLPVDSTKEVIAGIDPTGLDSSLQIVQMPPESIKVLVSGPVNKLNDLNSNNITIKLDLSTFRTAGTFKVDISRLDISTPEGISAVQFNPSSVTIKLENK